MYHAPKSLPTPSYPSPYRLLPHNTMSKCDKIHHLWITSNDHFIIKLICFSNQKFVVCYTSMIIYIQNQVSFLWVANFRGLNAGFASRPTLLRAFTIGHICITKNNGAFTLGVSIPTCYYPTHIFIFMYTTV